MLFNGLVGQKKIKCPPNLSQSGVGRPRQPLRGLGLNVGLGEPGRAGRPRSEAAHIGVHGGLLGFEESL